MCRLFYAGPVVMFFPSLRNIPGFEVQAGRSEAHHAVVIDGFGVVTDVAPAGV